MWNQNDFDRDYQIEKQTQLILEYFKLVKLCQMTYSEKMDFFVLFKGDKILATLLEASDTNMFDFTKTNSQLLSQLTENLKEINNGSSISAAYSDMFSNITWVESVTEQINLSEFAWKTITDCINSDYIIYIDKLKKFSDIGKQKTINNN